MFRHTRRVVLLTAALAASSVFALTEDFSSDPFANWSFGVGDNSNGQFIWNSGAAAQYAGDAVGSLSVHLNSALPTARLDRPLGNTYSQGDSFTLRTRFSFSVSSAVTDTAIQLAFGLVHGSLTGGDRTGSFADFTSDNFFHTVEFNYFPQTSTFNPAQPGPSLAPAVAGAQNGTGDAFSNFASLFGAGADLGGNPTGIKALPSLTVLEAALDFDGGARTLALTIYQVNPDGSLTLLETGVPVLDLDAQFLYDTTQPFVVDTLAIMAYHDGFTDSQNPSLVADMTFERFEFTAIPEPTAAALVALGIIVAVSTGRRR